MDAGLLGCRELDGALGLTEVAPTYLRETRGGRNVQHELVPLLRQSVYSRLAGYEDTNDAVRLARDPAMQAVQSWGPGAGLREKGFGYFSGGGAAGRLTGFSSGLTAVGQGIILGAHGREGSVRPYRELIWEIPVKSGFRHLQGVDHQR